MKESTRFFLIHNNIFTGIGLFQGLNSTIMVTVQNFKTIATTFPGVQETPHFEKTSFRVNKKIFATLNEKEAIACLRLSLPDQSVFCVFDREIIYPVPNKWGLQGWTFFQLKKIRKEMMKDALKLAYEGVHKK